MATHRDDFRHKLEYGEDGSGDKKDGGSRRVIDPRGSLVVA